MGKLSTLFISMIGLEERVIGFFKMTTRPECDKYLFMINKEYMDDKRVTRYGKKIRKLLKEIPTDTIYTSYFDSMELVKEFNRYILRSNIDTDSLKIFVDISTFNRQNLLTLLFLLRKKYRVTDLTFYYTVPMETNQYLSKCASGVASIPLLGGIQSVDKNKLLILLVGFEYDRAMYIWEKIEPSKTIIAVGDEPTDPKFLRINREVISRLKERIDCEDANVSANHPFKAQQDIEEIIKANRNKYNIIISPMNTKLQTVGLYFAWENFSDTQIVYSCPETFAPWLTKGIKRTDIFEPRRQS
jgi:hypothetical protein